MFHVFGQMNRRGKLRVRYARDVWWTNGLRIRICLVVLSNFHVLSFSIRATVYFILILKDLIIFRFFFYKYVQGAWGPIASGSGELNGRRLRGTAQAGRALQASARLGARLRQ